MNEWYTLTNNLETDIPPMDEVSAARVKAKLRAALPRRQKRRWIAALLAAALVLTACGYAAATGQFSRWFRSLADRDAPEADEDLLASMGTVIGQSQTADGVTATLHGAVWDGQTLVLSLSLEGADMPTDYWADVQTEDSWLFPTRASVKSALLETRPGMEEAELEEFLDSYMEYVRIWFHPELTYFFDRETQTGSLLIQRDFSSSQETPELELHLEDLEFGDTTLRGPFDFTFTVERRFPEAVYEGSALLEQENGSLLDITRVTLTPLQAVVEFEIPEPMAAGTYGSRWLTASISGLFVDGEIVKYGTRQSTTTEREENGTVTGTLGCGPFRQVVDPSAVTGIVLDGWLLDLDTFTLSPLPA